MTFINLEFCKMPVIKGDLKGVVMLPKKPSLADRYRIKKGTILKKCMESVVFKIAD